jgi:hypothetical protein
VRLVCRMGSVVCDSFGWLVLARSSWLMQRWASAHSLFCSARTAPAPPASRGPAPEGGDLFVQVFGHH